MTMPLVLGSLFLLAFAVLVKWLVTDDDAPAVAGAVDEPVVEPAPQGDYEPPTLTPIGNLHNLTAKSGKPRRGPSPH